MSHAVSSMKVGTDAVLLAAVAQVAHARSILDAGTGCGVIALAMAQRSPAMVEAIDIHEPSVGEATENFRRSKWQERLSARHISLQELAATHAACYDIIISNPPFFSNALPSSTASRQAARHNQCLSFTDFACAADILLKQNGTVWVVLPVTESMLFTSEMARKGFMSAHVTEVYPETRKGSQQAHSGLSKEQ
ncbi:MAG: methyltransferase [Bacteroidales bacterium]|nr:methyltransferase [Bacteroidales bacterium]